MDFLSVELQWKTVLNSALCTERQFLSRYNENRRANQGQLQIWTEHSTLIFENLKPVNLSYLNPKGEDSSCKIDWFMATYPSKLKWAFLSLTLLILKINTTFKDGQMMLKLLFDFSTGFRFSKISVECTFHSEAPPCISAFASPKLKPRKKLTLSE